MQNLEEKSLINIVKKMIKNILLQSKTNPLT